MTPLSTPRVRDTCLLKDRTRGYVLSCGMGLLGLAISLLSIKAESATGFVFRLDVSYALPLLAAMAQANRGAIIAFIPGLFALSPFAGGSVAPLFGIALSAVNLAWLFLHARPGWHIPADSTLWPGNRFVFDFAFEAGTAILLFHAFGTPVLSDAAPEDMLSVVLSAGISRFISSFLARSFLEFTPVKTAFGIRTTSGWKSSDRAISFAYLIGFMLFAMDILAERAVFGNNIPLRDLILFAPPVSSLYSRSIIAIAVLSCGLFASKLAAERTFAIGELERNEHIYRTLVEHLPLDIALKDLNSRYLSANRRYCLSMGANPDFIKGSRDSDWFPEATARSMAERDERVIRTNVPEELNDDETIGETRIINRSSVIPVNDESEKPWSVLLVREDITARTLEEEELAFYRNELERKVQERSERLAESGRRILAILDSITESAYLITERGIILTANRTVAHRLGFDKAESLAGRDIHALMDGSGNGFRPEWLDQVIGTGREARFTESGNGRIIDTVISPVEHIVGKQKEFAVFSRDITEERLSRVFLEIQKETAIDLAYAKSLEDGMDRLIKRILETGYFTKGSVHSVDSNSKFMKLISSSGFSPELLSRYSLVSPESSGVLSWNALATVWESVSDAMPDRDAFALEGIGFVTVLPVAVANEPVASLMFCAPTGTVPPDGIKPFLEAIAIQAAELFSRIIAEEATREKTLELETFAYAASHDLREPLRTIRGFAELLATRYSQVFDDRGRDYLARVMSGSNRMEEMLQGILDYSRITTRGDKFKETSADNILDEALESLGKVIAETGTIIARAPLPVIFCDPIQIERVFINLIGNSIKYVSPGTRPRIRISVRSRQDVHQIDIDDNGIGVPVEFREQIFRMFQRLHARSKYPGTGLGLTLARKIAERHGGAIWMTPNEGGGSKFSFTVSRSMPGTVKS